MDESYIDDDLTDLDEILQEFERQVQNYRLEQETSRRGKKIFQKIISPFHDST